LARDFYVVAADIQTGEEVVINLGKVADAIRASISIPGIFKPKKIGNRLLVDGAVKNHIPVNVLINHGVDFIIAVDIRFGGRIGVKHKVENIFDIILLSLEIPNFEHVQNLANQCDILIQPDLSHISPARFDLVEECMQIGIKETKKVIPILKHKLQKIGVL
jgi:NTE family protein